MPVGAHRAQQEQLVVARHLGVPVGYRDHPTTGTRWAARGLLYVWDDRDALGNALPGAIGSHAHLRVSLALRATGVGLGVR